jgi:DNA repair exonuclease SbcCD nuclease subunit
MMANEPVSSSNVISNELSQASDGDVFLIHQGIAGANVGNGYVLNDEWLSPSFVPEGVQVIAGHYHTPQVMGNILIPGALNQHNWGDAGQKRGFWHWKGDEFLFIESRTTRFHKLDMCDTSGFDDKVIEKLAAPMFTDDGCCGFVRVSNYLGDKEELRGAIYDASDGRCRGIEFEVVKTVSNKEDVDLTAYVDQEKFVKDWIKANRPPHFGSIGTKLYEGTYETP